MSKSHKTAGGKAVDMDSIRRRHETMVAVGNAKFNARGDLVGPNGKIIQTRDERIKEHKDSNEAN